MKAKMNVFGQRICALKDCPIWYESDKNPDYNNFCEAHLDYPGRIEMIDGKPQFGVLCKLPIGFEVVRTGE